MVFTEQPYSRGHSRELIRGGYHHRLMTAVNSNGSPEMPAGLP